MSNVFLVDLEAVESRYTGQWKTHVPKLLKEAGHNVTIIEGPSDIPNATTPALFLTLAVLTFTKLARSKNLAVCLPGVKLLVGTTLFLLMLGILVSLI